MNKQFKMVHFSIVDDFEETIFAPNIIQYSEMYLMECEYETDTDSESDFSDNSKSDND